MQQATTTSPLAAAAGGPAAGRRAAGRGGLGDRVFEAMCRGAGLFVLLLLGAIIATLFVGGLPAFREFGPGFLWSTAWNPVEGREEYGALVPVLGTVVSAILAILLAVPVAFGIAFFLTELAPAWLRQPIGTAVELLAAIPSIIYGMWGLFVLVPFVQQNIQLTMGEALGSIPLVGFLFESRSFAGTSLFTAGVVLAIMVLPFIAATMRDVFLQVPPVLKESAYGLGATRWEVVRGVVLPYTRVSVVGGIMLGLGRAGRDHGRHLRDRQRQPPAAVALRPLHDHRLHRGDGVPRKPDGQPQAVLPAGARLPPLRHLLRRARCVALAAAAAAEDLKARPR